MKLEELQVYQLWMEIGEKVWDIVIGCDYFLKRTIGKQLVRAADSVAASSLGGFERRSATLVINIGIAYYTIGGSSEKVLWEFA